MGKKGKGFDGQTTKVIARVIENFPRLSDEGMREIIGGDSEDLQKRLAWAICPVLRKLKEKELALSLSIIDTFPYPCEGCSVSDRLCPVEQIDPNSICLESMLEPDEEGFFITTKERIRRLSLRDDLVPLTPMIWMAIRYKHKIARKFMFLQQEHSDILCFDGTIFYDDNHALIHDSERRCIIITYWHKYSSGGQWCFNFGSFDFPPNRMMRSVVIPRSAIPTIF